MTVRTGITVCILFFVASSAGYAATECNKNEPPKEGIVLNGTVGRPVTIDFKNPIDADASGIALCWLSEDELQKGVACRDAAKFVSTPSVSVGRCIDTSGTVVVEYPQQLGSVDDLAKGTSLVVSYTPSGTGKDDPRYLRVEWSTAEKDANGQEVKDGKGNPKKTEHVRLYRVSFLGSPPDLSLDPRHKLWLFTGFTFLYSRKEFADSFAELRLHTESRWADALQSLKVRHPADYARLMRGEILNPSEIWWRRGYTTFRGYGEMGLTSTTANTTGTETTTTAGGRREFDLVYGFGIGKTWVVAVENPDINTNAFSALFVARASHISIAGTQEERDGDGQIITAATKSVIRFKSFFGFRVENETGHFKGSYGEFGYGESNQFELQKTGRAKFDGFLPFNDPGLLRVAARLQVDIPSVFAKLNRDSGDTPEERRASHEAIRAGDVKISILFNIDIRDLMHRLGTPSEPKK